MSVAEVPPREELPIPTLRAIEQRGGSASIHEIAEDVAALLNLPEEVLEVPHLDGPQSEFLYQAAWARTYLKQMDAVENSSRGVWSLTDYGRQLLADASVAEADTQARIRARIREYRRADARARASTRQRIASAEPGDDSPDEDATWQDVLLATLRAMPPDAFERLCQRVLREHGFTEVEVTGRSGDGGIDGKGVLRIGLVSFPVVFQCKRYEGSVGSGQIRDFRGAMVGLAEKGLFLTTGRFSRSAQDEAVRPGAPAIDLIDGLEFCQLLKERDLGVRTETETVEHVSIDPAFFASI